MATSSFNSLHQSFSPHHHHHHHHRHHNHHHHNHTLFPSQKLSFNLSPYSLTQSTSTTTTTTTNTNITTTFSLLTPTTPSTTSPSFDSLANHLSSSNFRQADEETRRLLIALAGEQAQKRGYVFFSEVQFIASEDLQAIDNLWKQHSNGRFGYSVQKRIWEKKAKKDFTRFFIRVGWMKKLDTEVVQWNYKSFPDEFIWEMKEDTPEGHLPLTNALRGTQLLISILTHPAFKEDEGGELEVEDAEVDGDGGEKKERPKLMGNFKTDYSF